MIPPLRKFVVHRKSSGIDRITSTPNSSVRRKLQRHEKGESFFVVFFPYRPQRFRSHLAPHPNLARHRPKASSRPKKRGLPSSRSPGCCLASGRIGASIRAPRMAGHGPTPEIGAAAIGVARQRNSHRTPLARAPRFFIVNRAKQAHWRLASTETDRWFRARATGRGPPASSAGLPARSVPWSRSGRAQATHE